MDNYWENLLLSALAVSLETRELRLIHDDGPLFQALQDKFPVAGSKINWSSVPGAVNGKAGHDELADRLVFFREHALSLGAESRAYYLSDGALDFAVLGNMGALYRHLPQLLENPQHHYFTPEDFAWCIAFTMEGDMHFGRVS